MISRPPSEITIHWMLTMGLDAHRDEEAQKQGPRIGPSKMFQGDGQP